PLSRPEMSYYLHHRLVVAGYQGGRVFGTAATWLLERRSQRVPRLVNILAHKSLLSAFGRQSRTVRFGDVLAAARDTASVHRSSHPYLRTIGWLGFFAFCAA